VVARVDAPVPATQPFAEQQMGAAAAGADATAAEPGDRFAGKSLGGLAPRSAALASAPRPQAPSRFHRRA